MDIDDSRTDPDPRLDDIGDGSKAADDHTKPRYKSWKKKYRKMRVQFDQKVHESEELHKKELKGIEACKRIAIENDRILEILLDINNSNQIPPEKRIKVSSLTLDDSDDSVATELPSPAQSLQELEKSVPHLGYEGAVKAGMLDDIEHPSTLPNADPDAKPPSFLTADDIDNYIFEIDSRIAGTNAASLPTLAPLAHHGRRAAELAAGALPTTNGANGYGAHNNYTVPVTAPASSSSSYQLRNPASVYSWLRRYCPYVFLQDGEKDHKDDGAGEKAGSKAKSTTARGGNARAGKRAGNNKAARAASMDNDHEDDDGGTPAPPATGRNKRKRDDDPGYRPKGGSSRPAKKKRKNEGTDTPTVKRQRKVKKELSDEIVKDVDMEGEADVGADDD